jgi:hypothetical protein
MPIAVAEYLRHLATRCSRIARDTKDRMVTMELEVISVELIEKAEELEATYKLPGAGGGKTPDTVIFVGDDDVA